MTYPTLDELREEQAASFLGPDFDDDALGYEVAQLLPEAV